ncbi:MAG: phosphotransferase [Anaerolineaceae bacterium]|nr:phosphotransferase [Anaerolineaceae bacterium]
MTFQIDDAALAHIWAAHGLGEVRTVDWAGKGVNNPAFVINDAYVIRFDGLINEGVSRFEGEKVAYDLLKQAGIPCPEVIILDDSKTLAPYDYTIMTKVEGTSLLDSWSELTPIQQQAVAQEAGQLLARMHNITLSNFGDLYGTEGVFDSWYAYIMHYFEHDSQRAVSEGWLVPVIRDRMHTVLEVYRPLFETVTQPRLIHWDYHFGNLMQKDGKITAVLDFEWALGGDPAHDFNRRDEWESECPGSSALVYKGYTSLRPLQPDHETRVALYEMLWFQDCVINARDAAEADFMRTQLAKRLMWLEEHC